MTIAGPLAHRAAIMTLAVVLAAWPVSAHADPAASPLATDPFARSAGSRIECGTYRIGYPNGSYDPLLSTSARLRSTPTHRAVVGIPQTAPGGLAHPVVKRFIAQHDDALARCYPRRLPASTGTATIGARPIGPGQIGLSLAIFPSGKVQLLGALGFDAEVTSCMAKVIAKIEFPRSKRGEITHTFVPVTIVEEKR